MTSHHHFCSAAALFSHSVAMSQAKSGPCGVAPPRAEVKLQDVWRLRGVHHAMGHCQGAHRPSCLGGGSGSNETEYSVWAIRLWSAL